MTNKIGRLIDTRISLTMMISHYDQLITFLKSEGSLFQEPYKAIVTYAIAHLNNDKNKLVALKEQTGQEIKTAGANPSPTTPP